MNETLAEHFNVFVDKRINQVDLTFENDTLYQERQNILYGMDDVPDVALTLCENLQLIAKKHAYKQGFVDGLTFMAGLSA